MPIERQSRRSLSAVKYLLRIEQVSLEGFQKISAPVPAKTASGSASLGLSLVKMAVTLPLWAAAKPGENAVLPAAEDVRRILPEGPILSIKVTPFRWQVVVKRGKTPETTLLLKRVFDTLGQYFAQNGYRPCCAKCGAEGVMPIYQCGQIMRALCDHCAGETAFLAEKNRKRARKPG